MLESVCLLYVYLIGFIFTNLIGSFIHYSDHWIFSFKTNWNLIIEGFGCPTITHHGLIGSQTCEPLSIARLAHPSNPIQTAVCLFYVD